MEQHLDQMRKILALADTGLESLEYLLEGIKQGKEQIPLYLLPELVDAFMSINESVALLSKDLPSNEINKNSDIVAKDLTAVCLALEGGDIASIRNLIEGDLVSSYRTWQHELAECFNPFVLS